MFLNDFSKKLKPEEPSIWNEKVSKTSNDVHAFKRNKKKKGETCANCSCRNASSVDAALVMLSAAYHFTRANRAAVIKGKVEDEYHDVKIDEDESDDDIAATDNYEAGVCTPRLWWFEKEATDEEESSAKTEIAAVGSSRPTVFKPVDWTKCLK